MTPFASMAVVIIGTVTLLLGAWIGSSKDDIKKVLAGSTMSQIGYMILAAGIGGPALALAIFHLLTHGFFKANMFLGAGSVMHAMDDDVNMRHYGALRKELPITFWTFLMGYLAIIGVPGVGGLLLQGPHHRRRGRVPLVHRGAGHRRRRHHRVLHDSLDVYDLVAARRAGVRACTRTSRPR